MTDSTLTAETDRKLEEGQTRYFSDQLMLELAHVLVEKEQVSRAEADELQSRRAITGESLSDLLLAENLIEEETLLAELSRLSGFAYKHIGDFKIDPKAAEKLPAKTALKHKIMPLSIEGGVMTVATSTVPDASVIDGLRMVLDMAVTCVLCTTEDIRKSLTYFYGLGAETIDQLIAEAAESQEEDPHAVRDIAAQNAESGMVRFLQMVIAEAIRMDATDIHIEPFEDTVRLRYRIDGILQEIPLPKGVEALKRAISSATKIMADMDIAERRKPHDGRIRVRCEGEEFDLRVSVLPTGHGETVNMRILNRNSAFVDLQKLGLTPSLVPKITGLTKIPHGVALLTGPTGSGKTTTLYALLSLINNTDIKIITVEDPVEYQMHGINQVQVHSRIGLTFANVLRSILRHDPDVVLIGEIRDSETADIAVRASLTGHLVFSTLHTNDAPSAITRLADMGVEPYLISSCLEGVIAQRLVRRVCTGCADEVSPPEKVQAEIIRERPEVAKGIKYLSGHGCPECSFTGYRGRSAINEVMILDEKIRAMVVGREPANVIKSQAIENGMLTLRQDGWSRVAAGITSVDEVLRVAGQKT